MSHSRFERVTFKIRITVTQNRIHTVLKTSFRHRLIHAPRTSYTVPQTRGVLEKVTVTQLVTKSSVLDGTVFIRPRR